jgi:hypothetical protein
MYDMGKRGRPVTKFNTTWLNYYVFRQLCLAMEGDPMQGSG